MTAVERDPSGLLERVPELAQLAEKHLAVRRAIEQGRPHAVYRALLWLRWLGKAGPDADLVRQLLATRRLFIQPLNGAPAMITYNGIGSRAYGESEPDGADASHIKTLFLVVLFVPVYPFSAYLVRRAERGWTFFGRVPLSATCYLWQRALALFGVVAVLIGAVNAGFAMRYNTVQIANALPLPIQAQVGGAAPITVASGQVEKLRSKVGVQEVVIKAGARELERGKLEVRRGYDVNAWNVLGAGALYLEDVAYTAEKSTQTAPSHDEPVFHCGENEVLQDGVNFAFTTPPQSISMGEHEQVAHRTHFALAEFPPAFCVYKLGTAGKAAQAKTLASELAKAMNYEIGLVQTLAGFFGPRGEGAFALELLNTGRKQHDSEIEYQRSYQSQAIYEGRRAEIIDEYRARAQAHPDSADDAYLLGRILSGPEADRFVSDALVRFPRHPYLLRGAAYRAFWRGEYAETERCVDTLRTVDAHAWQDVVDLELRALAAGGKIEKARALANECLKSPNLEASNRFETVVNAEYLARFEPKLETNALLANLKGDSDSETKEIQLTARVNACADVTQDELASLDDKHLRARLELELASRKSPSAAFAKMRDFDEQPPGITTAAWALLLSEAARLDARHPALERLLQWSPFGRPGGLALISYVQHGTESPELEDFLPEVLAAADYVRSRDPALSAAARKTLRDRASREDALHGLVTVAMNQWPE
jgi:hypothetical protein